MSTAKKEAQSSSNLPVRQGALSAEQIRAECPRFRILIVGKANAGKTTILRKVCNAKPDAKPIVYDAEGKEVLQEVPGQQVLTKSRLFSLSKVLRRNKGRSPDVLNPSTERGEHNIEYQLTYPGSNFIFHDSRGIEAGSEDELETVKKFIQTREQNVELENQLHVIWYCVPMDDQRPMSAGEKVFFSSGTGSVPVVLIFTKFDSLVEKCYQKLRLQGKNHQEAKAAMHELANKTFQDKYLSRVLDTAFPPKAYTCLAEMNKEENQCSELSEKTMDILDNDVLVNLFVSTQQNNLDLCIKKSIKEVWGINKISAIDIVGYVVSWFPNYWDSSNYKPALLDLRYYDDYDYRRRRRATILEYLSLQFPSLFSQDKSKEYQGLLKFQAIAIVVLLAEHSFWFSGSYMPAQFLPAIKSFKAQKHINITLAAVETAFNNASHQNNSAWLIQWVINNKLHK